MKKQRLFEVLVGSFMLLGLGGFVFLAFMVSGLTQFGGNHSYYIQAEFDNIGDLKVRAPVTIAGVRVGEVTNIKLRPDNFVATVTMKIDRSQSRIPQHDATARILTQGLLGSNYISIIPGFEDAEGEADKAAAFLQQGSMIEKTQPALILENLIGQLLFNVSKDKK